MSENEHTQTSRSGDAAVRSLAPGAASAAQAIPPGRTGGRKQDREPGKAANPGDMRVGMSFWSTAIFVAGLASDLAKPVADLAIPLFVVFLLAAAACVYLTFIRKPPVAFARTALGASGIGVAVFGFFIGAQLFATPQGLGQERGFIAAVAPPVAAVQTAILPLTETEKTLLTLSSALAHGEPEVRAAAARNALTGAEDPNLRRMMMERVLRNTDANVRQAALVQALADLGRARLPILTVAGDTSPLATALSGGALEFRRVDVATGAASGYHYTGGGYRAFSASIANGRLIVTTPYMQDGAWRPGLVIELSPDSRLQLTGTARMPDGTSVVVEAPLL